MSRPFERWSRVTAAIAVAVGVRAAICTTPVPSLMRRRCARRPTPASVNASVPHDSAVHTESKPRRSASCASSTKPGRGPAPQYPNTTPSFMQHPLPVPVLRSTRGERTLLADGPLDDAAHHAPAHARQTCSPGAGRSTTGPWASLAVPERITYTSHDWTVELARGGRAHRAGAALDHDRDPARPRRGRGGEAAGVGRRALRRPAHRGRRRRRTRARLPRHRRRRSSAAGSAWTSRSRRMRRIWAGEPPFDGADPVGPPPVQDPAVPAHRRRHGAEGDRARRALGRRRRRRVDDGRRAATRWPPRSRRSATRGSDAGRTEAPHLSSSIWYALGDDAEAQPARRTRTTT